MKDSKAIGEKGSDCPDVAVLSAFFDKELDLETPEAKHIAECPLCGQVLSDFNQIDKELCEKSSAPIPDGLTDRICAQVRKEAEARQTEPSPTMFPMWLMRIAAALILGGTATYFAINFTKSNSVPNDTSDQPNVVSHQYPENPEPSGLSGYTGVQQPKEAPAGIPLKELLAASFGNDPGAKIVLPETKNKVQQPAVIKPKLRQVWVIKNFAEARKRIDAVTAKLGIPAETVRLEERGDSLVMRLRLTKQQLVGFVRCCECCGFDLLSPNAPQPEQKVFVGNANDIVDYNAEFVVGGK